MLARSRVGGDRRCSRYYRSPNLLGTIQWILHAGHRGGGPVSARSLSQNQSSLARAGTRSCAVHERENSPWVRGPCVHASASHTCLHWEFPAIQRRRRPSLPDVHPNPNRLTGTKMAPLVARVSRSSRGRGPAVQPGTLSCVALVERDSLSKDVIVPFACLVRWGNSPDRRGQSIFRLGHTAVVLYEPHVCPPAASAFPLPFARVGEGGLSWHTVASPKRVAAHTHDHAHENAKKREAGLPFVETMVILEDEGEGL